MKLIFQAPLNQLSLGQVSYNVLRELYKRDIDVAYYPMGNVDLGVYQPDQEFVGKLQESLSKQYSHLGSSTLKLWHLLHGGEQRVGNGKSTLYTFHETSELTEDERAVVGVHDNVIVSSQYSRSVFNSANVSSINLGFDPDFHEMNAPKLKKTTHWGLVGKFEKRKHTAEIIKAWAAKYGNSAAHHLTCVIFNPFMKESDLQQLIGAALEGKPYHNIQFMSFLKTNADMNTFINSIDIDLSGLSGAEGWGLPAFNATALGKWSVVLNATAHKDWATADNCCLVEPSGEEFLEDRMFFRRGANQNQGNFFTWNKDEVIAAMEKAESLIGTPNLVGKQLQTQFSYARMVDEILEIV